MGPAVFTTFGPVELILIIVIVLIVFGAGRLAGVGKALGTGLREFRQEAKVEPEESEESEESKETSTVSSSSGESQGDGS